MAGLEPEGFPLGKAGGTERLSEGDLRLMVELAPWLEAGFTRATGRL